ncbi:MAG: hypothetical protein D4R74_12655 [Betaproteobacteria bacterium]|nr:MAG: hypothetical protein D4R74_12655 [Betaproteobacteria bacterium]
MTMPGPPDPDVRLSPGARALLGFLRAAPAAASASAADLTPGVWQETLELALHHGVASLLHRALESRGALPGLAQPVRAALEHQRRATALDNLRNYGQFRRVARALRGHGIAVIALKGLHLAELVYRDISLRPMADLDILVSRSQVEQTVGALHELDFGHAQNLAGEAGAMLDIKCNIGFAPRDVDIWLEVHWSLDEPPARFAAVLEDIWRSAVPARVGDADTLVMSPEFLLLHVCAHLACNHTFAFSLRALCDIAEIARKYSALDWAAVVDHGRRNDWCRGVAAALRLASDHLGAAVPARVLTALGADALDPRMLAEAMQHLLSCVDLPGELVTAPNLLALHDQRGPAQKLAAIWARVFVPRAELALRYGVPERSARLGLFYAVRLRDLLRRYAASAWALNVSDPELAVAAARHARLASWIKGG